MNVWFDRLISNYYNDNLGFEWRNYSIFDLTFDNDTVHATVGTGIDFFDVKIQFRQFTIHEKDKLMSIAVKPDVLKDLVRGIVPDEFFNAGVNIFPKTSIDLMVDCSCWGLGLLCNEAMAVLNKLNSIFKSDPFLIFSLKGFDLGNIDSFPIKCFNDIFNNSYDGNLTFLLDRELDYYDLLVDLKQFIDDYDFSGKSDFNDLVLNLDSNYNILNNPFKNNGDLISFLKSVKNPIADYAFDLIKTHNIVPEIFKLDNGNVYTRWIPSNDIPIELPVDLIKINGKSISNDDQVRIMVSLIVEDFITLSGSKNVPDLLLKVSKTDSVNDALLSNVSRNLSVFNMKYDYQINVTDGGDGFVLEFEFLSDDLDYLRYTYHIRKLFAYFGIYWNLNEPLKLNNKRFRKYMDKIEKYLTDLNVKIIRKFNLYESTFKIKLTLDDAEYLTVHNLSSSNWMIDLGNCLITTGEFQKLHIDESGIIKINDDYYIADPVKFKSLQSDILFLPTNFESYELLQIALLGRYRNLKFDVGDQFKQFLEFSGNIKPPASLNGQLRPYQEIGYSWLIQNIKSGFGSILADDMGLGKTIQVLASILYLKENNLLETEQVLIIAPTTLITNWVNEIGKFTSLTYSIYHGNERQIDDSVDLILTSYGMIRSDEAEFRKHSWFLCVVDEAQNIKNPNSKQSRAVKNIKATNRIALTGTPIENHLTDYWSIFDFTNNGYLKSLNKFKKEYVNPVSKNPKSRVLDNLKIITQPFILRRLKTDENIIDDLPDKIVNDLYCDLTVKQSGLYDDLVKTGLEDLKDQQGIKRKGNILKLITSLKQICNHPYQYLKKGKVNVKDSAKLELLIDIVSNMLEADEKVIIFTQYVEMGRIIEEVLLKKFNREVLFLHGSLNRQVREKIIDNFQNNASYPILIATLKTGGVGLNLTSAQNVIHYDLWWNPAVENQATDRAYRIGQDKDVMVYRFITKGTLEEKIDLILKNKLELADNAINSNETFITELSDEELREIFELRQ